MLILKNINLLIKNYLSTAQSKINITVKLKLNFLLLKHDIVATHHFQYEQSKCHRAKQPRTTSLHIKTDVILL